MGLFSPVWMTLSHRMTPQKLRKAEEAIRKISNQEKLRDIALKAPDFQVQKAAIGRLSDPEMLYSVVENGYYPHTTDLAAERIRDEDKLTEIAIRTRNNSTALIAVKGICDPDKLMRVARESCSPGAAESAVNGIADPGRLRELAMGRGSVAGHAASLLKDPDVLREIALNAPSTGARQAAVSGLGDADLLIDLIETDTEWPFYVRDDAFNRLWRLPDPLTDEQRERMVQLFIRDADKREWLKLQADCVRARPVPGYRLDEFDRIYRQAVEGDSRAEEAIASVPGAPDARLPELWQEAAMWESRARKEYREKWETARLETEKRMGESGDVSMLTSVIRDASFGPGAALQCIRALFAGSLDDMENIGTLRDEAVEAFAGNLPAFGEKKGQYAVSLARILPPAALEKYGIRTGETERETEDQFGCYTYTEHYITWRGVTYSDDP